MSQTNQHARHAIEVDVECRFVEEKSSPEQNRYLFYYVISISNKGSVATKLLTRHWIITDGNNKVQEVRGEGVVGEQPHLQPGEKYRYSSAAMIETSVGTMRGEYQMIDDEGEKFDVPIDQFVLSIPRTLH